jgi:hypoxanthine phosphoribosyltransferase
MSGGFVKVVYSEDQIREATRRLASALNRDYEGRTIHFLGVLKGSFIFLADLVRQIEVPCSIDFVRLSSYGGATASSGVVEEVMPRRDSVAGRDVVVVEEIVDSGTTLFRLLRDLEGEGPTSLKVCALVDKRERREVEIPVHYSGMVLDRGFLLGYGLDLDEIYRNLPAIYVLPEGEEADSSKEEERADGKVELSGMRWGERGALQAQEVPHLRQTRGVQEEGRSQEVKGASVRARRSPADGVTDD